MRAWAARGGHEITALEFRPGDAVYAWDEVRESGGYERFPTASRGELRGALERLQPQAVVCVGYADPEIHLAAAWAFALLVGSPAAIAGAAVLTAQMAWKAKREEAFLRQELGPADYDAYAARTPMLIPFLRLPG